MNQRQSAMDTGYRGALSVYVFVLVLVIYGGTNDPTIHIKTLLSTWAAMTLAGSYLLITWLARIPLQRPPVFREVLLCLIGFLFVSSLFSEFRAISLLETGRFFALFALYWLASQVFRTPTQVARFFIVLCIAVTLAAVYAVLQDVGLDPYPWNDTTSDTYTNLPATFGNPNYAAHALILVIIMIIGLFRMGYRWSPWLLPLIGYHLYRTDQRAGWIALAGAGLLVGLGWILLRNAKRPVLAVTATLLLTAFVGSAAVAGVMFLTYERTGHAFPLDLSLLLRYQSYVSATNMLLDAPVLGHGPAVYGLAYAPYWTAFEQDWFAQELRVNEHVHNDLIELALDGGLAAAGLYLVTLLLGMAYGLLLAARGTTANQRRLGFVFAALFSAFAIDGLFGFNLRVPVTAAVFFLLLGCLDGIWVGDAPPPATTKPWRGRVFRIAFFIALLLATRQESKAFLSEYYFAAGARAQGVGQLEIARAAYTRSEEAAPWNWHPARRIGMTLLDEGKVSEGRIHLERSLKKNPHYILTHLPMARASLMLAQNATQKKTRDVAAATTYLEEARSHAREILDLSPQFPAADEILGRVESIAAIIERDYAAEPRPEAQQAHWMAAREHLRRAIGHGPENTSDLYQLLMRVELSLDDPAGAEQAILGAVQTTPEGDSRAWALFQSLARETGNFASMRDALYRQIETLQQKARDGVPDSGDEDLASAYDWLAAVQLEGFKDTEGAADAFREAIRLAPLRPDVWARFAAFAYEHDALDGFGQVIQESCETLEAAEVAPLPQVAACRAVLAQGVAQLDQASRVLLAGVRSHAPGNPLTAEETFGWAARFLLDQYRIAEAAGTAPCETALNLGIVSAGIRKFGVADGLFKVATDCLTDERKAVAAIHWADTMVRTARAAAALTLLEKSALEFPNHVDTQWAVARTLAQAGRIEDARIQYNNLLGAEDLSDEGRVRLQSELDGLPPFK